MRWTGALGEEADYWVPQSMSTTQYQVRGGRCQADRGMTDWLTQDAASDSWPGRQKHKSLYKPLEPNIMNYLTSTLLFWEININSKKDEWI